MVPATTVDPFVVVPSCPSVVTSLFVVDEFFPRFVVESALLPSVLVVELIVESELDVVLVVPSGSVTVPLIEEVAVWVRPLVVVVVVF
jgi:hypothetical protein